MTLIRSQRCNIFVKSKNRELIIIYSLFNYIKGYLRLKFTGADKIRFLNLCKNNNLDVWNVCSYDDTDHITFSTSIKSFYKMRKIRRKCRGNLVITEKHGIAFKIRKYRKRIFFLVGTIIFFVLIKIISLYIWNISFDGNYSYTDVELMNFLNDNAIHNGLKKSEIDCEGIEFLIRKQYNDITWVSVEMRGTRLIVHIKENFDTNIAKVEEKPYNIISNVDGVIESIITRSGVPMVKSDDEVTKGQLLVSGAVELLNDAKDVIGYEYVNSDADIYAYVVHPYHESFALDYVKKNYTGRNNSGIELEFFGKSLYLSGLSKHINLYDTVKDYKNLTITKNYYLPISVCKMSFNEYETEECRYSEDEARAMAQEKINNYIDNLQEKGIQIIENNVTIEIGKTKCSMSGNFLVKQKIGQLEYLDGTDSGQKN